MSFKQEFSSYLCILAGRGRDIRVSMDVPMGSDALSGLGASLDARRP